MSLARSQLISSIRTLAGEPPDIPLPDGLPTSLIFEELTGIEAMMLRDLNLSTQNARVKSSEVSLSQDQEDFLVTPGDFNTPAYVYLQTDVNSNLWHPVEIVERSAIAQANAHGSLAIAFSGTPTMGYVSWVPDGTHTLKIWYERSGDDSPTLSGSTELGNLYDEYLKLQTAAQCREHLKLEIGSMLAARLAKSEKQWQAYTKRGHQRGLGAKARLYSRRRLHPFIDRRRFFVP